MVEFLFGLIVFLEISHLIERRDLYNRIMAKDLTDFSANTKKVEIKESKPYMAI